MVVSPRKESSRRVLRSLGASTLDGASRRLALAHEFVDNRPELKRLLDQSGAGSHPRVVKMLAEQAGSPDSSYSFRVKPRERKGSK